MAVLASSRLGNFFSISALLFFYVPPPEVTARVVCVLVESSTFDCADCAYTIFSVVVYFMIDAVFPFFGSFLTLRNPILLFLTRAGCVVSLDALWVFFHLHFIILFMYLHRR